MKERLFTALLAAFVMGGLACTPAEETVVDDIEESRDAFLSGAERELEALGQDMEDLKERMEASGAEANAEVQSQIEAWERDYAALEARLDNAEVETQQALDDLEAEVDASIRDLRSTFAEVSDRLAARVQ